MKNIAVFVSGSGTNLQAIIDAIERHQIKNANLCLVLSNKENIKALERAKQHNIKTEVISSKLPDFNMLLEECLERYKIDLIVLAGFLAIIHKNIIEKYKNRIINIHPSLIPSFAGKGCYGLKVHEKVLEYGVKVSGATVHFVTEIPDDGPIILQEPVRVSEDDTPESLQKKILEKAEHIILPKAVDLFCNDRLRVEGRKVYIL